MLRLSVLDQSPIPAGASPGDALRNTIDLARRAEDMGYHRYWLAEHHNSGGLAGSSPEILIGQVAAATSSIRVGSGGVMLSHYSALKVVENFRMLEALFPGRIDLGIGRAPGSDQLTALALRIDHERPERDEFPQLLGELLGFLEGRFDAEHPFSRIDPSPRTDTAPELWMLGSSDYSASAAAQLGLPFSYAHFINPADGEAATAAYRTSFHHRHPGDRPIVSIGVAAICADSTEEAERLASSVRLWRVRLRTQGDPGPVPTVEEALAHPRSPRENDLMVSQQRRLIVGSPQEVRTQLEELAEHYDADELIIVTIVHDHAARCRSYELIAKEMGLDAGVATAIAGSSS